MKKLISVLALVFSASAVSAATVDVDLSGASSGTTIVAPGASFAGLFDGQTASGNNSFTGSPTGPLSLQASNNLSVQFFNGENTILPDSGNQGPLSILLDSSADELSFTMGFGNGGAVDLEFYDANGNVVGTSTVSGLAGYAEYTFSGVGTFDGVSIFNNTDAAGLRFYDFSYETVAAVPLPAGGLMMIAALGGFVAVRRRRKSAA